MVSFLWFYILVSYSFIVIESADKSVPHIIVVLADDLGWATIGYHDNEVQTPFIDKLALNESLILSRHYVYKYCSPTRSSFLSGRLPIHVNQKQPGLTEAGGGIHLGMHIIPSMLKLSPSAKYHTHQFGKWHVGESNIGYLPVSRGFDTSFGYLGGGEDHYTHVAKGSNDYKNVTGIDFWNTTQPAYGYNGIYGDILYNKFVIKTIEDHSKNHPNDPIFIYYAMQIVHDPQEAPSEYLDLYPSNMSECYSKKCNRRTCDSMASMMDSAMKNLTDTLKNTGMWNNTLLLFSADNGGNSGVGSLSGNNWPLRGGKQTDFEGGVRVNAFITGGYIPNNRRGKSVDGYIHICDWFETFANLVDVDTSSLPPLTNLSIPSLDSIDIFQLINGSNLTSPRTEIPLSTIGSPNGGYALISGKYKIINTENNTYQTLGFFTGPQSPNTTTPYNDNGCPKTCLFDIINDETEHIDLSDKYPDIKQKLIDRIKEISNTTFQTSCYGMKVDKDKAAQKAINSQINGYWAPFGMCTLPN